MRGTTYVKVAQEGKLGFAETGPVEVIGFEFPVADALAKIPVQIPGANSITAYNSEANETRTI